MIAVDTNLLVYAHRSESAMHKPAQAALRLLAEGTSVWCIPWPCVHEFLSVVTHPEAFDPPSTLDEAFDQLDAWTASPSARVVGETGSYPSQLRFQAEQARATGSRIREAQVAAICLAHGVTVLWTADRDYGGFPNLRTSNPLVRM